MKTTKEEPDKELLKKFNAHQKKVGNEKMLQFIEPGNPGEGFKKSFDAMLSKLTVPEHLKGQLAETDVEPEDTYVKTIRNGKYGLIPSFFKLVNKLIEAERDFAIVFHSFGSDLESAIAEFNA